MAKTRQFSCWLHGQFEAIKWGKREGKQRYKCKSCGIDSTRSNKGVSKKIGRGGFEVG